MSIRLIVLAVLLTTCGEPPIEIPPRDPVEDSIFRAEWYKQCRARHKGAPNIECFCDEGVYGETPEGC